MFKPELLSPAGTLKSMRYAFAYGADAVYAGHPRYSLRVRNNEFNDESLKLGIQEAHKLGKKVYVTINIVPHNAKLKTFLRDLKSIIEMNPDALIMSDPGLIMLTRKNFPKINIHLSVQANAINWATVKFWQELGLTRIILSRELSLEEIEEICAQVPNIEIEVFIHGSLCMAYSGRCLLSSYLDKRDANQGICTNICRLKYNIKEAKEDEIGNITYKYDSIKLKNMKSHVCNKTFEKNKVFIVEEIKDKNNMIIFEDKYGSYIMNSKDLCAIKHIDRLTKIGVHSFKIEGRNKSFYYCGRTAQIYRNAIDAAINNEKLDNNLLEALESLANRGYTEGFFNRHTLQFDYQNYEYSHSYSRKYQFVGEFTGKYRGSLSELVVKNKFIIGDYLELMTPSKNIHFLLKYMENDKGEFISVAPGSGYIVWILIPNDITLEYALLIKILNESKNNATNNQIKK